MHGRRQLAVRLDLQQAADGPLLDLTHRAVRQRGQQIERFRRGQLRQGPHPGDLGFMGGFADKTPQLFKRQLGIQPIKDLGGAGPDPGVFPL